MDLPKPFRWNMQKREQLGKLVERVPPTTEEALANVLKHHDELRTCCARVLSHCQDSSLVFIGRSPEHLFDYLSGVLEHTSWSERITLVPLSIRAQSTAQIRADYPPSALVSIRQVLTDAGLSPKAILASKTRHALVDVVYSGDTMRSICDFLCTWAREEGLDVEGVRRRLCIVGITIRTKTSPNTWRWHQHATWLEDYPRSFVKNVSISWPFWSVLGNSTTKSTPSHAADRWGTRDGARPSRKYEHLQGLFVAWSLVELGRTRPERRAFQGVMAGEPGNKHSWYRSLAQEVAG